MEFQTTQGEYFAQSGLGRDRGGHRRWLVLWRADVWAAFERRWRSEKVGHELKAHSNWEAAGDSSPDEETRACELTFRQTHSISTEAA